MGRRPCSWGERARKREGEREKGRERERERQRERESEKRRNTRFPSFSSFAEREKKKKTFSITNRLFKIFMSLLRLRAGYFLSGIGFGAGVALLQLRADLAASTELLSTQVRERENVIISIDGIFFQFVLSRLSTALLPLPAAPLLRPSRSALRAGTTSTQWTQQASGKLTWTERAGEKEAEFQFDRLFLPRFPPTSERASESNRMVLVFSFLLSPFLRALQLRARRVALRSHAS